MAQKKWCQFDRIGNLYQIHFTRVIFKKLKTLATEGFYDLGNYPIITGFGIRPSLTLVVRAVSAPPPSPQT